MSVILASVAISIGLMGWALRDVLVDHGRVVAATRTADDDERLDADVVAGSTH